MPRKSSKRRKPRRSSRRRRKPRKSSRRRKPRRSSRRRKPRKSSRRRKPRKSSRRRFKMHSWSRWPGGPPRGGLKRRKGDRPKRKVGVTLRKEKDRKKRMKLQRLFNDWFCATYPEDCGGGGGGKKAAYGFGNKFKIQNYKYSSKDFRRGDEFEKIEWIDPSKYYPKNCAVMDKKNKLFPWYPKVATVYPKYMRVLTHIQKRKRASNISVFTNIKYDQIKQIIWKGGGTESERNKKERRELARKFLTKKTKIPVSIINELVDKYLFNEGIQQKKKPKSVTKYHMNGGKWTEWEELRNSEEFWVGQLVRIVPFNGTFGPWSEGKIKKIDKNIIHLESSKNKVTVKINIKKIYMYKYYIAKRKPVKNAAKKSGKYKMQKMLLKRVRARRRSPKKKNS